MRSIPGAFVDPFAPADHPSHPSQIGRAPHKAEEVRADMIQISDVDTLIRRYATPTEVEAGSVPNEDELAHREESVLGYYETDDAADLVITDNTGAQYRWVIHEDETPDGWEDITPAADTEKPAAVEPPAKQAAKPRRARKATKDQLAAALAKLDKERSGS